MAEAAERGQNRRRIEHIIVLMMENRSFDHMLGYLEHPNDSFPGVLGANYSCPVNPGKPLSRRVNVTDTAHPRLGNDPGHSHQTVMLQVFGGQQTPNMSGFIESYRLRIAGNTLSPPAPWWRRLASAVAHAAKATVNRVRRLPGAVLAKPDEIMRCFPHDEARVLNRLALDYAVLVNWRASVPGETWPNRQFAHAATSHGTVNIEVDFYTDRTIFEQLDAEEVVWGIYQDGVAQVWAYPKLWFGRPKGAEQDRFHHIDQLFADIAMGSLPAYCFIEPNHGYGRGTGNSQHPSNNTLDGNSFLAGEALMARIHDALVDEPDLFAKTLFLITFDEHGGFYDHVKPVPMPAPDQYVDEKSEFGFKLSGVRVPAVAVSPLIPPGTMITDLFDHASIPATVRAQFAPGQGALTERDRHANDVLGVLPLLAEPRAGLRKFDLPSPPGQEEGFVAQRLDDFQGSLVKLAGAVSNALERQGDETLRSPSFDPHPATHAAAGAGLLVANSPADQVVESVVADFEREVSPPDPAAAEFGDPTEEKR